MNVNAVKLFLEVVEAGSLSKVAARRQTVQSHVSRQISDFEAGFGAPLFRRTGRGVALTELGERVARRLRVWIQETDRIVEELRNDANRLLGDVRLGIIPSAAHPLVTRVFERLQAEQPGVHLIVVEGVGGELDAMLDTGAVDMAILFRFKLPSEQREKLLCEAHTFLVSRPDDPLTAEPSIPFARLEGLRLVLPKRPSHWRNALDETARSLGFTLNTVAEADSLTVQKELVAHSQGVYSVLGPYSITSEVAAGHLRVSRVVEPDLCRHVTLALARQGKLSPAARFVAETIQGLVRSWGNQLSDSTLHLPGTLKSR